MNPLLQKIENDVNNSFTISKGDKSYFYNRWHYHPEIELTLIKRGSGTRLVGDSVEPFSEGELVLIGPHLPHFWRFDTPHPARNKTTAPEAVSIHFKEDLWGPNFLAIPEMEHIKDLLSRAKRGIEFQGRTRNEAVAVVEKILAAEYADRIILLLQMLNLLVAAKEFRILSILGPVIPGEIEQVDGISRICSYTLTHFQEKMDIKKLSSIANVSPNSFRRYFKSRTLKTYWQFLLDIRIGHACKLVMENKYTISQICFSCGFNNLANFNRRFKDKMGVPPLVYAKMARSKAINSNPY